MLPIIKQDLTPNEFVGNSDFLLYTLLKFFLKFSTMSLDYFTIKIGSCFKIVFEDEEEKKTYLFLFSSQKQQQNQCKKKKIRLAPPHQVINGLSQVRQRGLLSLSASSPDGLAELLGMCSSSGHQGDLLQGCRESQMRKWMWKYFTNGSYYFQQKVENFHLHWKTRQTIVRTVTQANVENDKYSTAYLLGPGTVLGTWHHQ